MKKIGILASSALALIASTTDLAAMDHSPYVGVALGASSFRNQIDVNEVYTQTTTAGPVLAGTLLTTRSLSAPSNKATMAAGGIMGWGFNFDRVHVGAELDYFWNSSSRANSSLDQNLGNIAANTSTWSNGAFGAALRAGYWFTDRGLGFVRLGAEMRRYNHDITYATNTGFGTLSLNETRFAFAPGLGIEMNLSPSWSLCLEGRTSFYGNTSKSRTVPLANGVTVPNSTLQATTKLAPRVDSVTLSMRYKLHTAAGK